MAKPIYLSDDDHRRISEAVSAAEAHTSGEIVTILAERSDGYTDVALAWSALVAFVALGALAIAPEFYLGLVDRALNLWTLEWTPREVLTLALFAAAIEFGAMMLLQMWQPLRFFLVPGVIKSNRVRERAIRAFRIGTERRTVGSTGVLIYLSMRERRAEIVAEAGIAAVVEPEVWGKAMDLMLTDVREGRVADGMVAAVAEVGQVLAPHFPRADDDVDELPDRLIEV